MFGSSGIGLYLVKELLTLHSGDIDVKSQVHEGTTFTITIPVKKEATSVAKIDESVNERNNESSSTNDDSIPKILVVEDNSEIRELIYDLYHQKFKIYTAKNGLEGYEMTHQNQPDLLILDVNMPIMNGYELSEKLKMMTKHRISLSFS